jgi:3-dehydroquinate dehydratase / shikimate dehydrogenase
MHQFICIPITETNAISFIAAIEEAVPLADIIELRLDYLTDDDREQVLKNLASRENSKPFLFTFRPREQGGMRDLSLETRLNFWQSLKSEILKLISYADFELDLVEHLADKIPPISWDKIICSNHNFDETPANIDEVYDRIVRTPAAVIKIATKANRITDCLPLFDLMERGEKPAIILGMGLPGISTRILSLSRGAMLTFGALRRGAESASGQPTATELRDLFRVHQLSKQSEIYGVVGNPVGHSRSPLIHNSAFKFLNRDAVYLPFEVDDITEFVRDFVHPKTKKFDWNLRGLSITIPYKISIMPQLDFIAPEAQGVGAINTVVVKNNELHGHNTDVAGAMNPLEKLIELKGARAAIIGAGGAARGVCYGLRERGADITIYARDTLKAKILADEFNTNFAKLSDFNGAADVIINCTPIGMQGHNEGISPVNSEALKNVQLVYDLIYNPLETQLLKDAKTAGCKTLGGMAMLIAQAGEQFTLWTGEDAPMEIMWQAVNS